MAAAAAGCGDCCCAKTDALRNAGAMRQSVVVISRFKVPSVMQILQCKARAFVSEDSQRSSISLRTKRLIGFSRTAGERCRVCDSPHSCRPLLKAAQRCKKRCGRSSRTMPSIRSWTARNNVNMLLCGLQKTDDYAEDMEGLGGRCSRYPQLRIPCSKNTDKVVLSESLQSCSNSSL